MTEENLLHEFSGEIWRKEITYKTQTKMDLNKNRTRNCGIGLYG
jgi:hypothetical protein